MRQRIITALAALVCYAVGFAGNISVDAISLKPGEAKDLKIFLSSSVGNKVGIQFDVTLPDGFSLENYSDGKVYHISSNQVSDMTCDVSDLGSNSFRFILYSSTLQELKAGELMNLNLKVINSKDLGNYSVTLSNMAFSDIDGNVTKESDVSGTIKVTDFFTLLYKVDGEDYKSYLKEYGEAITPEPAPTKEGYNFSGWSEIPATMPAHDVTVTGTFTIVDPVTITAKSYSRKYGEENPTFEYTSEGATMTGTPEITCEATITSPVGEYPIVISKGTVTNYNDHYVNGKLTVTKASLTITAKSYTIKQGETLPTFEATYEGFKNDETSEVLTKQPTITTTATSASEPGEYEITVSGAEAQNYEISYIMGTLTITAADPVTITAKDYTIEYGDDIPPFEYTSEGAELDGTPSITCEATKTSPVGTYPIVITKGTVKNYNDTYVNGTLTVTKAPLTITAKDYTMKQGEALPTFEVTYEGFKNDETSEVLTKQPIITTTATSESEPGEYEITVSGADAQNYDISYVMGTRTITAADPVTITAKDYEIEYGDDIPSFEYTSEGTTLDGTPEITCEATKTSPVGTYPIVITKDTVKNYNVTYVNGTSTVTKAPLTITAKNYTIKQGEALPTFEVTYEGFRNDETEAVLTKLPVITTTATSASEPGEYEITASGAEAQNYKISYVKGKLTIEKPAYILGDANGDGVVNVTDIVATVNYIMNKPSDDFNKYAADVNGDDEVNVTDIVGMVNIIMKSGTQNAREVMSVLRRSGFVF